MKTKFEKKLKRAKIVKRKLADRRARLELTRIRQREEKEREERLDKEARALRSPASEIQLACDKSKSESERPAASSFQRQFWQQTPSTTKTESPAKLPRDVFNRSAWSFENGLDETERRSSTD